MRPVNAFIECGVTKSMRKAKAKANEKKPKGSLPVAPNVLPLANSHIPAKSCTSPPQKRAMPTTTFGVLTPRAEVLYSERISVVDANENKPLPWSMCLRKKKLRQQKKRRLTESQDWQCWFSLVSSGSFCTPQSHCRHMDGGRRQKLS